MPFARLPIDTRYLPQLDCDDPVQRKVIAGCSLVYAPDPLAPGRILGCQIDPGRGLVPLFALFRPGTGESPPHRRGSAHSDSLTGTLASGARRRDPS